jgi:hypothetical protein
MMERLGAPQTHLGLKGMITEVDEDNDNKISFREFLLIFRKAGAGELDEDCGLSQLARLTEISVEEVGVNGAKTFFEAKVIFFEALFKHGAEMFTCFRLKSRVRVENLSKNYAMNRKSAEGKKRKGLAEDRPSSKLPLFFSRATD